MFQPRGTVTLTGGTALAFVRAVADEPSAADDDRTERVAAAVAAEAGSGDHARAARIVMHLVLHGVVSTANVLGGKRYDESARRPARRRKAEEEDFLGHALTGGVRPSLLIGRTDDELSYILLDGFEHVMALLHWRRGYVGARVRGEAQLVYFAETERWSRDNITIRIQFAHLPTKGEVAEGFLSVNAAASASKGSGPTYTLDGRAIPDGEPDIGPCIFCGKVVSQVDQPDPDGKSETWGYLLGAVVDDQSRTYIRCHDCFGDESVCELWRCTCQDVPAEPDNEDDYVENVGDHCHACKRERIPGKDR